MSLRGSLLAPLVACGVLLSGSPAFATAPSAKTEEAKALYDEGRKAYRRGDMAAALEKFEKAYDLTENPIILYNIGLTNMRRYETSNEIEHLRKAKVVLDNFKLELMRDPSLGNIEDVDKLIAEIENKVADHESAGGAATSTGNDGETNTDTPEGPDAEGGDMPATPPGQDPGRKLRLIGIGTLAGGGLLGIGAVVGAVVSQKKYFAETDALDQANADAEAAGCTSGTTSSTCDEFEQLQGELADRANAYRRNIGIFAGAFGGAAVVAIAAGGTLVGIGVKKTRQSSAQLRVSPTLNGVSISGRF